MKAFSIRITMVALTLIASFTFMPVRSDAQVKSTAAKIGFKAAKIEVVFHDAVKLADSIQKVSYRPEEDPAEFMKEYVTFVLTQQGVEVKDEAGEGVAEIVYYIGYDDADDDNDGTPDATDTQDFSGEAPADVKDSEIDRIDVDAQSETTRTLPNTDKSRGIYILVVNKTDDSVDFYYQAGDVLGYYTQNGEAPSAALPFASRSQERAESNHANLLRRPFYVTYGSPIWSYMMGSKGISFQDVMKAAGK